MMHKCELPSAWNYPTNNVWGCTECHQLWISHAGEWIVVKSSNPTPDAAAALAAIELIQAIHRKDASGFCLGCDYGWPCQTIEAINAARGGEQESLDHYADCDRAVGCTCGTRIIDNPQQEQE